MKVMYSRLKCVIALWSKVFYCNANKVLEGGLSKSL